MGGIKRGNLFNEVVTAGLLVLLIMFFWAFSAKTVQAWDLSWDGVINIRAPTAPLLNAPNRRSREGDVITYLKPGDKVRVLVDYVEKPFCSVLVTSGERKGYHGYIRKVFLTRLDGDDENFKKYFHLVISLLYWYGWVLLLAFVIPLIVFSYLYLPGKVANWAMVVCLVFTLVGVNQGSLYHTCGGSWFYAFCNLFYVPTFLVFHGGVLPYFIILCISIKEHNLSRKAGQALADRRDSIIEDEGVEYLKEVQEPEREETMLPDIPDVKEKMNVIGQYFLNKSKDSMPTFDIEYLEGVKTRFLTQFKFISEGENKKLNLLIQHVNGLIEYERARNRLEHVEGEKRLDNARRYTEYKKLQAECMRHELEIIKLSQEMEKTQGKTQLDPVKEIKERLRLENKKKEVYLDNKVKTLRSECANNIKLKRELRRLLAEETMRICGGDERNNLTQEQIHELEDVEDYIQAKIDQL